VNDVVRLKRKTGSLEAGPQGRRGHGRLAGAREWIRDRMAGKSDTTLDGPTVARRKELPIRIHRSPVGRLLHGLGPSHGKKDVAASEREREDVTEDRRVRMGVHRPSMRKDIERPVFIDETLPGTNMIKATGRAPVGKRPVDRAPVGRRITQPFIAAVR